MHFASLEVPRSLLVRQLSQEVQLLKGLDSRITYAFSIRQVKPNPKTLKV